MDGWMDVCNVGGYINMCTYVSMYTYTHTHVYACVCIYIYMHLYLVHVYTYSHPGVDRI